MRPPRLETKRLVLRPPQPDDLDDIHAYARDPQVSRYLPWNAHRSPSDTARYLDQLHEEERQGHKTWVIEERTSKRVIGTFNLRPDARGPGEATIGFAIGRTHWGQGYGAEAGEAVIAHARTNHSIQKITATVWPDNESRQRLLKRLRLEETGREERPQRIGHGDAQVLVYTRTL